MSTSVLDQLTSLGLDIDRCHFEPGQVSVKSDLFQNHAQALDCLVQFGNTCGWISFQSGTVVIIPEDKPHNILELSKQHGKLLWAELASADGSIQVRRSNGLWYVITIQEGAGERCLVQTVKQLTVIAKNIKTEHRIFWIHNSDCGWQASFSRLSNLEGI